MREFLTNVDFFVNLEKDADEKGSDYNRKKSKIDFLIDLS